MNNLFLHEQLYTERQKELEQQAEQIYQETCALHAAPNPGRQMIGQLGRTLVSFGTWLEKVEQQDEAPVVVS